MNVAVHAPAQNPRMVGVVPALADCFQDRAAVDDLRAVVGDGGGTAVLAASRTGLLSGMGGVGKTQLAAHLAKQLLDERKLDLLVWVTATSRQAILERYAQAAVDVGAPGAEGRNIEHDAARFHAWLATTEHRWLVVLDDLTETAHLQGLWPPTAPTGRTVVTTRLRSAALTGTGRTLIQVGVFDPGEAEAYIRARLASHPHLADDPAGVAEALGYLPLALSQATAFILNEEIPCSEYRQRLAGRRHRLDDLVPTPEELPDDYQRTIVTAFSLSVEAADRARPARLATPLLRLASVLNPAGIPTRVFATAAARRWLAGAHAAADGDATRGAGAGASAATREVEGEVVQSGLRLLHRFNLATVDGGIVRVHGLIQRSIREQLSDADLRSVAVVAADALAETWPSVERDKFLCQVLRANTDVLYQAAPEALLTPTVHTVLYTSINNRGGWGNPAGAANAYRELLRDMLRVLGPDHPDTLQTRVHLAHWRGEAGNPTAALTDLERLLDDTTRVLGPDHMHAFTTRAHLAHWRGEAGSPTAAADAYGDLVDDMLRVLGPDDPHTLHTRANLAYWLGRAGNATAAADAYGDLVDDMLRVLGPDNPHTLHTRANLARWRAEAGDPTAAASAYEHLLTDVVQALGPDHPDTLTTRAHLAHFRGEAGDPAAAARTYEQLLSDRMRVLGADHPHTLHTRGNLAHWRGKTGDATGAAEALEAVLDDMLRVLGADHPDTLTTRARLACWRGRAGNPTAAADALEAVLDDMLRVLGPDHPDTLTTRAHLAHFQGEAGDPTAAVSTLDDLLRDRIRVLGADHLHTLMTRGNLARWQALAGDVTAATDTYQRLLTDVTGTLGPDHPYSLVTRTNLANCRGASGDVAGAASALDEVLQDMRRLLGPNHPHTQAAEDSLACWKRKANRADAS